MCANLKLGMRNARKIAPQHVARRKLQVSRLRGAFTTQYTNTCNNENHKHIHMQSAKSLCLAARTLARTRPCFAQQLCMNNFVHSSLYQTIVCISILSFALPSLRITIDAERSWAVFGVCLVARPLLPIVLLRFLSYYSYRISPLRTEALQLA